MLPNNSLLRVVHSASKPESKIDLQKIRDDLSDIIAILDSNLFEEKTSQSV